MASFAVCVALERDVARGARLDREDRLHAAIAVGDDDEAGADDRRGNRDLGVARQPPELLAGRRVVAADERRRLRHELGVAVALEDGRRGPRRNLLARASARPAVPVATSNAAMNEFFWMSHCTITRFFQMIGELPTPHS